MFCVSLCSPNLKKNVIMCSSQLPCLSLNFCFPPFVFKLSAVGFKKTKKEKLHFRKAFLVDRVSVCD